jgi:FixJ family two-component response regulator
MRSHVQSLRQFRKTSMSMIPLVAVVDDDEAIREAVDSLIRSAGYRAQVFASGEDFLHSKDRVNTGCLIVDVRMPRMSGFELQRRLTAANCRIPLIFITAHGDEDARAQALSAGAVDFLYKPFSGEILLSAVQAALYAPEADR